MLIVLIKRIHLLFTKFYFRERIPEKFDDLFVRFEARVVKLKTRFDDGWISQQERTSLNDLARCDNRELLGHVTERYAQFVHSHDVSEFVTNLRAVLMTSEFP